MIYQIYILQRRIYVIVWNNFTTILLGAYVPFFFGVGMGGGGGGGTYN